MRLPALFLALPLLALTGCSVMNTTATPGPTPGTAISGNVHGGQQPIVGAHVYLRCTRRFRQRMLTGNALIEVGNSGNFLTGDSGIIGNGLNYPHGIALAVQEMSGSQFGREIHPQVQ